MRCETVSPWGKCAQETEPEQPLCYYHLAMQAEGFHVDRGYHKKIVLGLLQPTGGYLTQTEIDTMFSGRTRSDGRRLDRYTE